MTRRTDPHVEQAERYALDVVNGRVSVCRYVRQAIERQRRDLTRQGDRDFPFVFDVTAAERVCDFLELLPHVKGPKANAGESFVLEPWQCWFVTTLFGWRHWETGARRFRRAYEEVPRGNGKSFKLAGIANYCAFADGEMGAEVYSGATKRDQAKISWGMAKRMLQMNSELTQALGVHIAAHSLHQATTGSVFLPLSSEYDTFDGLNVYAAIVDELHAHPNRKLYDVLETATAKRLQSLLLVITTAGADRTGICYEIRDYLIRILDGEVEDDRFFGVIYTIDEGDDWRDEASWRKANPNLGVSVDPDEIRSLAHKAEKIPAAQSSFKTKHLNVWVGANAALFDVEGWMQCGDLSLKREQFEGQSCISGLDLATKDDIAPRLDLFWRIEEDEEPHLYVFGRYYMPGDALEDGRNERYPAWASEGWISSTPGETTDMAQIEADIIEDSSRYAFDAIGFDPWQAMYLAQRLLEQGAPMIEVRPTVQNFSEATKTLGALIKERRIHHNGDPVLAWAIGNVVGHYDAKENVFPRKERDDAKIDPVVALIMALSLWLRRNDAWATSRHFEEEGLLSW